MNPQREIVDPRFVSTPASKSISVGTTLFHLLLALAAVIAVPRLAQEMTNRIAIRYGHSLDKIDPNGVYVWSSLHHLWQLALTLIAMLLLSRTLCGWGFTLNEHDRSLRFFRQFFLYYTGIVVVGHLALFFVAPPPTFPHPLTGRNIVGELGFKLLLSGTCEEPLFRGLVMTLLYRSLAGVIRVGRIEMPYAGLAATLFFMLAHIGFSLSPLAVTWLSVPQLLQAGALGLFYAYIFHQTRSLLSPILIHNYFNFSLTALGMIWVILKR